MKILCLSTLDKFSRFYLDIEHELSTKSKSKVNLKVFSIYLSGYLYPLLRFKFSCWISVKAWFRVKRKKEFYKTIVKQTAPYKGISFNDNIKFHTGLNKNISILSLQSQALAYIDIFESIFNTDQPDALICIGDSRLCIEIAMAVAKQKNVKIYFIEQGPFNTTFFDTSGVNANLSVRNYTNLMDDIKTDSNIDTTSKSKSIKYNRSPFYRGLDMLFMYLFEHTSLYPPDLKFTDLNSFRFNKNKGKKIKNLKRPNQSVFLLVLQVPLDVNMIYHSPIFKSHTEIIKSVYANLPSNTTLIVREHPLYINKYENSMYEFVKENEILIDNYSSLHEAMNLADVVIVNNSTVGIEALLNYKTTVVLGNAFYDHSEICLKLKTKNELGSLLKNALNYSPNRNAINNFKHLLFNNVLLEGSISEKDLISSKQIVNYLLAKN
jgi:capsular polysaccharide export protein